MTSVVVLGDHHVLQKGLGIVEKTDGAFNHFFIHIFVFLGARLVVEAASSDFVPAVEEVTCLKHTISFRK